MTADEFLHLIWPSVGVYVLATPFTLPGTDTRTYAHRTFTSIADAARYAEAKQSTQDVYFAVHSVTQARVWNPNKLDRRTNTPGAHETRTQRNMQAARSLFLDLDVGDGETKYATQADALRDLRRFLTITKLPNPLVVSSGYGLHVYWPMTEDMPSAEWRVLAAQLRLLVNAHQLRADPSRTTDVTSVLRVAGTINHKRGHVAPVAVWLRGGVFPRERLALLLQEGLIRAGVDATTVPSRAVTVPPYITMLGENLAQPIYDGPTVTLRGVVDACAQIRHVVTARGNVSEPLWYHTLNVVRFVERGEGLVHNISSGHPQYTAAATNIKLQQLAEKQISPSSCSKLAEVGGSERCAGCAFAGRVKNPLQAARFTEVAAPPVPPAALVVNDEDPSAAPTLAETIPALPDPPAPYFRMKAGGVAVRAKNKEGDEVYTTIFNHDLYPLRRVVNSALGIEQQTWCVVLPRVGPKEFTIDADALYDRKKFIGAVTNHGLYPMTSMLQMLQDYMIAYISVLQQFVDHEAQVTHLGWNAEHTTFALPTKVLTAAGDRPVQLSTGAQRASLTVQSLGDLPQQSALLQFYAHPAYLPNQFFVLASLAAPIFYMTGHHGVVVNACGDAGSSKSTSLYTAASVWGQPELYPINGTNNGATMRGRSERVTTLANLPICVDEITHMAVKDAVDLAMSVTQPGHRIRLQADGVERIGAGSTKSTIMLTTANASLHGMLSMDNAAGTAGSMRVIELQFAAQGVHTKAQADDYLHALKRNHGHIGEAFLRHVLAHHAAVEERVRVMLRAVDQAAAIAPSERFWSATMAAVLVAGEIAHEIGLVSYDMAALKTWLITRQIPTMRGDVASSYTTPYGIMAEYLEQITNDMIIISHPRPHVANIQRTPRGALCAHYDVDQRVMWVLRKSFRDYCTRTGANALRILDELYTQKVVTSKSTRKILGVGTDYAKAQSTCFTIDMKHPDITGAVDLSVLHGALPSQLRRA